MNGTHPIGELLPSEKDLINTYGVSRITAKRALDELAEEGLVRRERGRGTFVIGGDQRDLVHTPIQANINALMSHLSVIGLETTVQVKQFEYLQANPWVCEQLQLESGALIQKATRIRLYKNKPFSISISHVPEEIGRNYTEKDLYLKPMVNLIQNAAGASIQNVQQTITCTLADETTASMLEVNIGSPLLKLRRVFITTIGKAVNYAEMLYSPQRFEYKMNLVLE